MMISYTISMMAVIIALTVLGAEVGTTLVEVMPDLDYLFLMNDISKQAPSVEDMKQVLMQKCEQNGPAAANEKAMRAIDEGKNCILASLTVEGITRDVIDATRGRAFEPVIQKYCSMIPQLEQCVSKFITPVESCLDAAGKGYWRGFLLTLHTTGQFICIKDGARLIEFITDGGFECVGKQMGEIKKCAQSSDLKGLSLDNLPSKQEYCKSSRVFKTCLIRLMKSCEKETPGKIIKEVLNILYEGLGCNKPNIGKSEL